MLIRISKVPDHVAQRHIVTTCKNAGLTLAKAELAKAEEQHRLKPALKRQKAKPEPEAATDERQPVANHVIEDIQRSLEATSPAECLGAIASLKRANHELRLENERLRSDLAAAKAKPSRRAKAGGQTPAETVNQ